MSASATAAIQGEQAALSRPGPKSSRAALARHLLQPHSAAMIRSQYPAALAPDRRASPRHAGSVHYGLFRALSESLSRVREESLDSIYWALAQWYSTPPQK